MSRYIRDIANCFFKTWLRGVLRPTARGAGDTELRARLRRGGSHPDPLPGAALRLAQVSEKFLHGKFFVDLRRL